MSEVYVAAEKQGPHGLLLVVTDKSILKKVFKEGNVILDLRKEFYLGKEQRKEEIKTLMRQARDIHLTGKASVALGIEMGLVDASKILYVEKIPHAVIAMG